MTEKFNFSRNHTRIWYNPSKKIVRFVLPNSPNHTTDILNNPEIFGLTKEDLPKNLPQNVDYVGEVLYPAMKNGWVRIFLDNRKPDTGGNNVEGTEISLIRDTVEWLKTDFFVGLKKLIIAVRHSEKTEDGTTFLLYTPEDFDFFINTGKIRRDKHGFVVTEGLKKRYEQ